MDESRDTAIILVAHGTRNAWESEVVFAYGKRLQERVQCPVYPGFGEFLEPTLYEAMAQAFAEGYEKLKILPYFLFESSHVKQDLQQVTEKFIRHFPTVSVHFCSPINYHERMLDILIDRLRD
ncbi:CbiX/SirB N-terminal domain-containing protein [Deltaproteobacteria bacterium TL4]